MKLRARLAFAAALLVVGSMASAQGFFVNISVDENGNGRLTNTFGFDAPLPFTLADDPGPGGLPGVCTYDLLGPPGLTAGDVLLVSDEPGIGLVVFDIVRFNPDPSGFGGSLVFYSDNVPTFDSICDTSGPPGALYPNFVFVDEIGTEVNNLAIYRPLPGQPGFVAGAGGPVTYFLHSDVPEPGSLAMLMGTGVAGCLFAFRRFRVSRR